MKPHYLGAVYELTQENMQGLIKQLDEAGAEIVQLKKELASREYEVSMYQTSELVGDDELTVLQNMYKKLLTEVFDKTEALESVVELLMKQRQGIISRVDLPVMIQTKFDEIFTKYKGGENE